MTLDDFFGLRRMWTPVLAQAWLVLMTAVCVLGGIAVTVAGALQHQGAKVAAGLALAIFGPPISRLFCEVIILPFRNNELLAELVNEIREQTVFVALLADAKAEISSRTKSSG